MADEEVKKPEVNGAETVDPLLLKLRKPVQDGGGHEVSELKFREPTGGDIERIGNPIIMDVLSPELKITFDARAMSAMMSLLAGVPPSSIRTMHPKDWNSGAWKIANFFVPDL